MKSKRIVFTWELGGGYGHITSFLPLARRFQQQGHRVSWILRDLTNTESLLKGETGTIYPAPVWPNRSRKYPPMANYSELLFCQGYLQAEKLTGIVRGWISLLKSLAPDLLICDHSPTALLASREMGIPRALIGTGFFRPPDTSPFPSMMPWKQIPKSRLLESDRLVLQTVNSVSQKLNRSPLGKLTELFDVEEDFLCTFPELDPYHPQRQNGNYWGPRMDVDSGVQPDWPLVEGKRIFVYLRRNIPQTAKILKELAGTGLPVLVHLSGGSQEKKGNEEYGARVRFSRKPVNMSGVCQQASAIITHAGHGVVSAALLAGIPLLMLPTQQEQLLTTRQLVEYGMGIHLTEDESGDNTAAAITQILNRPEFRDNAQGFVRKYADFDREEQIELMLERCAELLGLLPEI